MDLISGLIFKGSSPAMGRGGKRREGKVRYWERRGVLSNMLFYTERERYEYSVST